VLVNPTRYLGNLLIAGGLIQAFAAQCRARGTAFTLVVDAPFVELLRPTLPEDTLLAYPRGAINRAGVLGKLRLYGGFVRRLRALRADLAFNIEEDSTSDRLTRWSGAAHRLGCSPRHRRGYDEVLQVDFVARPAQRRHRWYSFMEVFAAVGLPEPLPGYLRFPADALPVPPLEALRQQGFDPARPYAAVHAGATKDYKKWPAGHFARLARLLHDDGLQVVFIGAGADARETAAVFAALRDAGGGEGIFDATNQFTLAQLGGFLRGAQAMVGNDSGPFHLAAALGVKGVVIFGPTDAGLWRPLGDRVRVLQRSEVCSPDCSRKQCQYDHACLKTIGPENVVAALQALLGNSPA
jgi:heptosyltransferase-3